MLDVSALCSPLRRDPLRKVVNGVAPDLLGNFRVDQLQCLPQLRLPRHRVRATVLVKLRIHISQNSEVQRDMPVPFGIRGSTFCTRDLFASGCSTGFAAWAGAKSCCRHHACGFGRARILKRMSGITSRRAVFPYALPSITRSLSSKTSLPIPHFDTSRVTMTPRLTFSPSAIRRRGSSSLETHTLLFPTLSRESSPPLPCTPRNSNQ